ncbi:hypothetical protein DM806_02985 [Sphingobium lactosutens]|uniref:MJ0042-type zinc finger domain-containing protein n=1 Tax=Sphingobium lactosutens TaxID=522773 RepID=UPI003567A651|nr:hypothetical protein [Sphingobium lactosutens]
MACPACGSQYRVKWYRLPLRGPFKVQCKRCPSILLWSKGWKDYEEVTLLTCLDRFPPLMCIMSGGKHQYFFDHAWSQTLAPTLSAKRPQALGMPMLAKTAFAPLQERRLVM